MQPVLTGAETRTLDRETEARGTPVALLMERAGRAVARTAADLAGGTYGRRAVVVAGKGNNGGDGLVAARHLAGWGAKPTVMLLAEPTGEPAAENLRRLRRAGVRCLPFTEDGLAREVDRADVAIDAIFGIGFRGLPEGPHAAAIATLNGSAVPLVAIDIPSGVEGDTGAVRGEAVVADVTVTFGAHKVGTLLPPGSEHAGVVQVADIGFPPDLLQTELSLFEHSDVAALLAPRAPDAHKRSTGVVLVVAGSRTMTGAPSLVARGAYRTGAGLVTVAVPEGILPVAQAEVLEATFLPLAEDHEGSVAESAWETVAERLGGFDAVAVGPGLSPTASPFVRRLVAGSPIPLVVDADALNAFAGSPADLAAREADAVITPHAGEFGRLFGMSSSEVLEDRVGFVRKAAEETRSVVLLKGPRTLVATPGGEVRVNPTGSSALATGGTGDVLTGAVAACLARGLSPADAASVGAYVHGLAGELVGRRRGEGATAADVAAALPEAILSARQTS